MESILITGGAGFIGSNFVRAFMQRYGQAEVHVLDALTYAGNPENLPPEIHDNPRFHFWYGNVCNAGIVSDLMRQVDTVIHFAAESHVARSIHDNVVFFETDVIGTRVIADQVLRNRKRIKRFVHISTSEVYGSALTQPMTEEHPLMPFSPYAAAKCGADRLVYSYAKTYGIPAVIIRPFNQYGPFQHLEKCIPRFITSALDGKRITLHGDGSAARDWCYVTDTCDALLKVLEAPLDAVLGEVINLGTGTATNIETLSRAICEQVGRTSVPIEHIENRPGQVDLHVSSTDKAERLLGWRARTTLEEGLARTIDWYRKNQNWWRKLEWMKHVPITMTSGQVVMH